VGSGLDEPQARARTLDQSAAETARLTRQNDVLAAAAASNPVQIARDLEWAAQNDAILARWGGSGGDVDEASSTSATGTPEPSPSRTPDADASDSPSTLTVIITGSRPAGTAFDVTLPAGDDEAADITRAGTPTQLLTGNAAAAALLRLGVPTTGVEALVAAAGRLVLYAGERAVGVLVPGVGLLVTAALAHDLIHSGTQQAPGDAFEGADGNLYRPTPAADGGRDLQMRVPQTQGSPEEAGETWVTVGRFVPLSDEERAQLLRPIATPLQPQRPQSPPPLPAHPDRMEPLPGYAPEQEQPGVIGTPALPQPSWEDLIIEASNSEKLGQNLREAGRTPPLDTSGKELQGYRPHHMLPSEKWPGLNDLRRQFAAWNIDLNSADNGVWLPGYRSPTDAPGSYHESLHNGVYRDAFRDAFDGITTKQEALGVLASIRSQLEKGEFPGTRPRGP